MDEDLVEPETRLIVNADDFGLTHAVNEGIIESHARGILTSATLMANMPAFQDAVELAKAYPNLGLGVHVNLSSGVPLAPVSELHGLVGSDGKLPGVMSLLVKAWLPDAYDPIRAEMSAQVKRVLDAGVEITHLDSHKHVMVHPTIAAAAVSVAQEFGIKAVRAPVEDSSFSRVSAAHSSQKSRLRSATVTTLAVRAKRLFRRSGLLVTDRFFGIAGTGQWDEATMASAIRHLGTGTTELMVHPGRVDDELRSSGTRLLESRVAELDALTSDEVKAAVRDFSVRLVNFGELSASG
jgi:chitin disaccharide deacetylase